MDVKKHDNLNKLIKKKRRRGGGFYQKIDNNIRLKLLNLVNSLILIRFPNKISHSKEQL